MHPPWEMTIDRPRSSTFLMYMLLHDVGEDYWSISYFFYNIFFNTTRRLFIVFFYRVKLGSVARMLPLR